MLDCLLRLSDFRVRGWSGFDMTLVGIFADSKIEMGSVFVLFFVLLQLSRRKHQLK